MEKSGWENEVISLLNENKVKMMTKMAIYEKNEGKKMLRTAKYYKVDYIAFGVLKNIIAVTLAYIIIVVLYAFCNIEKMIADISSMNYARIGGKVAVYYIIMLVAFSIIAGFVSSYQYEHSRKGLKRYFSRLNKLERFYKVHKDRK